MPRLLRLLARSRATSSLAASSQDGMPAPRCRPNARLSKDEHLCETGRRHERARACGIIMVAARQHKWDVAGYRLERTLTRTRCRGLCNERRGSPSGCSSSRLAGGIASYTTVSLISDTFWSLFEQITICPCIGNTEAGSVFPPDCFFFLVAVSFSLLSPFLFFFLSFGDESTGRVWGSAVA